jgi:hypothetical protein
MTQYKYVQGKGLETIFIIKFYHIKKKTHTHCRLVLQSFKALE